MTGSTTIIVLIVLYGWGGEGIHAFCFALLIGCIVGTYSSIYIAYAHGAVAEWRQAPAPRKRPPSPRDEGATDTPSGG